MTAKPQPHNHAGHSCHCHSSDSKETGARNVVRDPVCGMKVDRAAARHMAKQEGRRFYFCSSRCQEKFEAEPTEINHNYLILQLFPASTGWQCGTVQRLWLKGDLSVEMPAAGAGDVRVDPCARPAPGAAVSTGR